MQIVIWHKLKINNKNNIIALYINKQYKNLKIMMIEIELSHYLYKLLLSGINMINLKNQMEKEENGYQDLLDFQHINQGLVYFSQIIKINKLVINFPLFL